MKIIFKEATEKRGYIAGKDVRGYYKMTRRKVFFLQKKKRKKAVVHKEEGAATLLALESQVALPTGQSASHDGSPWRGWWLWLLGSIKESDTSISNQKPGKCLSP